MDKLKVIFIAGYGRSGSTFLGGLLGAIDGCFHTGEFHQLWKRGLMENWACECGQPFRDCLFWRDVIADGFGDMSDVDVQEIRRLRHRLLRPWRKLRVFRPFLMGRGFWAAAREYGRWHEKVIRGINKVSGARVIVDSSKTPAHGLALTEVEGLDVHVVHLVRDSRAVAYSFMRHKAGPGPDGKHVKMPKHSPMRSAKQWVRINEQARALEGRAESYLRLHYEDFVAQPAESLRQIMAPLGMSPPLDFLADTAAHIPKGHSAAGNPVRFKEGPVQIRLDEEWKHQMRPGHRRRVTFLTARQLRRYGYPLEVAVD